MNLATSFASNTPFLAFKLCFAPLANNTIPKANKIASSYSDIPVLTVHDHMAIALHTVAMNREVYDKVSSFAFASRLGVSSAR